MSRVFNGRREDFRLVTGQGKYTADWNFPDQVYGHFLRSDHAHAEIVAMDIAGARAMPGVLAVLTGEDTAREGFKSAPPLVRYPGRGGIMLKQPNRDVLAVGRVRYVGEEVALVVATSAAAAHDAAEKIEIEYRELPLVIDADAALADDAPQLYPDIPGNVCFDYEYGDEAKTAAAFAQAAHVTRLVLDAPRMVGNPMEPKSCTVAYDAASGIYDVYAPTQGLGMMLEGLHGITGIAEDKIRVHAHDVGGGFGIRGDAYPEYCALMLAAKAVGRPVKWMGTRAETFLSDHHGRAAMLTGELALDKDGNFLASRYGWVVNAGAYLSHPGPFINTLAPSAHAPNVYRIPTLYGRHQLVLTNTTSTTAYRGAARPNVTYIVERLVDEAARELGVDRIALRHRNLIRKEDFPYKTPTGSVYDSGDPPGLLDEVVRRADCAGFETRRADAQRRGKLRGMGIAMFIEPSGGGSKPKEEVSISFGAAGNPVIHSLSGASGQGHETVFPEVVAGIFGIAPEKIVYKGSDPFGPKLVGEGTIGSRSLMSHGGAMVVAAREVVRKGIELAAKDLEVAASDLQFADGKYFVPGTDVSIGIEEIARRYAGPAVHPLDTNGDIPPPRAFPSGAHVVEVEIDQETGVMEIIRYVAVDDCGTIINPTLVAGQLHGGLVQGLAQVAGEHCVYDKDSGQMLTGSFMDYYMPRADLLREVHLHDRPVPSPGNPLGAKGAGEAGTTGAVPTLACAIIDALRPLGITHLDLPYTPDRLWQAMQERAMAVEGR
jgi:aerobic carbon-monoxide dehydrogenase large subunit